MLILFIFLSCFIIDAACFPTSTSSSTTFAPSYSLHLDKVLTMISKSCLSNQDREQISGNHMKSWYTGGFTIFAIDEAINIMAYAEMRSVLGLAPPGPWKKYKKPTKEELASTTDVEEYFEMREQSEDRSLDSLRYYEKNLDLVISFFDKRFPSLRKSLKRYFQGILRDDLEGRIDKTTVDHFMDKYESLHWKIYSMSRELRKDKDGCDSFIKIDKKITDCISNSYFPSTTFDVVNSGYVYKNGTTPSFPVDIDKAMSEIAGTCLTLPEREQISGSPLKYIYLPFFTLDVIKEAVNIIAYTEMRSVLGLASPGPWKKYMCLSKDEFASTTDVEEYFEMREHSIHRSLDSPFYFERNFPPVINFFDKRFPSLRKSLKRYFQGILQNDLGGRIDKKAVDRLIDEYERNLCPKFSTKVSKIVFSKDGCNGRPDEID